MEPKKLPAYLSIEIETQGDSKKLFVCSRRHVNKRKQVGPTYTNEYTDQEMLRELGGRIAHDYL